MHTQSSFRTRDSILIKKIDAPIRVGVVATAVLAVHAASILSAGCHAEDAVGCCPWRW